MRWATIVQLHFDSNNTAQCLIGIEVRPECSFVLP